MDSVIKTAANTDTSIKQTVDSVTPDKSDNINTTDCSVQASTSSTSDSGKTNSETNNTSDTSIAISEKDKLLVKDGNNQENRGVKR